ncbi:calmodulin-like protein 30 [Impatiens glandulifera]|uniref:calmodulin-like protein 30 n=1 Tax=Impatiens glandulifera TaxID=253017 RepID=UPI001FB0F427|nr:calmodulin-like protein 30 [Impatiens glandulifera]
MSTRFLDFQYSLSKKSFLKKPSKLFSSNDRQNSGLPIYQQSSSEIRRVFDKFDSNKDGKISPDEYKDILIALGRDHEARDVRKIFEVADLNGDGFIDFKEFTEAQKKDGGVKTADIQSAFRAFDKDGDGKISVEEVFELLKRIGERCSLRECRKMVRAVDKNGDGAIDFDEFVTMMTRTMKLH